jgi:hypothetical protein
MTILLIDSERSAAATDLSFPPGPVAPPVPATVDRSPAPVSTQRRLVSYVVFVTDDITRQAANEASARRTARRAQAAARQGSAVWW